MQVRVITTTNSDKRPYLVRITLFSLFGFNVYLHVILRSDEDRALHDHPWPFVSIILVGGYWEHFIDTHGEKVQQFRSPWSVLFRRSKFAHRVELPVSDDPALTLVFTGRRCRKWGFHCPQGWVHWKAFVGQNGCGEE